MSARVAWLVAPLAGLAVGGGSYALLTPDPILASALGVVYAAAGWLVARNWSLLADGKQGWAASRWSSAAVALSLFAALFGPHQALALPRSTTFMLQLLVVGTAWTTLLLGVSWAEARASDRLSGSAPADD